MKNRRRHLVLLVVLTLAAGCSQNQVLSRRDTSHDVMFRDDFESYELDTYPGNWITVVHGANQNISTDCPGNKSQSFKLQSIKGHNSTHYVALPMLNNIVKTGVTIHATSSSSSPWAGFITTGIGGGKPVMENGFQFCPDGMIAWKGRKLHKLQKYEPGKTYELEARISFSLKWADVYVNGKQVGNRLSVSPKPVIVLWGIGEDNPPEKGASLTYFDDIIVKEPISFTAAIFRQF